MPDQATPRPIRYEHIDNLRFDSENPRIPEVVSAAEDREVLAWMLDDASLTDLMRSIATQGFFEGEPLLVVAAAEDTYDVVEGNRRLAALRLLQDPSAAPIRQRTVSDIVEQADYRPERVPVVEFDSREDILDYLGYRHVTGVKPWEPLAKARYVSGMWDRLGDDYPDEQQRLRRIAHLIGSGNRSDYVAQMLTALGLYRRLEASGLIGEVVDPADVDFSLLTVALGRREIPPWLGLDSGRDFYMRGLEQDRLDLLGSWLFELDDDHETVIGESRNMGRLAAVVAVPQAVAELERGRDLERAVALTSFVSKDLVQHLVAARSALDDGFRLLPRIEEFDVEDLELLREISRITRRMYDALAALSSSGVEEIS